jgi:hypothetical protein
MTTFEQALTGALCAQDEMHVFLVSFVWLSIMFCHLIGHVDPRAENALSEFMDILLAIGNGNPVITEDAARQADVVVVMRGFEIAATWRQYLVNQAQAVGARRPLCLQRG